MKNITIIGAGALGSHLVLFLRAPDMAMKVVDGDRVEQKNILSQFHTRMGLNRNKAQALQQALQGMFGANLQPVPHMLSKDNVDALLKGSDLVIDCVDNGEARRLIQGYVRKHGIPCLHGALAADGGMGRVVWDPLFTIDDAAQGQATCTAGDFLPLIAQTAACMAAVVQMWLQKGKEYNLQVLPGGISMRI
jgi:molybdopterin/thiamine biosynthesis adenylyltransferase